MHFKNTKNIFMPVRFHDIDIEIVLRKINIKIVLRKIILKNR